MVHVNVLNLLNTATGVHIWLVLWDLQGDQGTWGNLARIIILMGLLDGSGAF